MRFSFINTNNTINVFINQDFRFLKKNNFAYQLRLPNMQIRESRDNPEIFESVFYLIYELIIMVNV
jgi:hypothetical protein